MKTLYTAYVEVSGGRGKGRAVSSDGHLDIDLTTPGTPGKGTNPEQLLAAGWSACFEDAIDIAAFKNSIHLPGDTIIRAEVDLCADKDDFKLKARLHIVIPGIAREIAEHILVEARKTCPYTKAIESNIPVAFSLTS